MHEVKYTQPSELTDVHKIKFRALKYCIPSSVQQDPFTKFYSQRPTAVKFDARSADANATCTLCISPPRHVLTGGFVS